MVMCPACGIENRDETAYNCANCSAPLREQVRKWCSERGVSCEGF